MFPKQRTTSPSNALPTAEAVPLPWKRSLLTDQRGTFEQKLPNISQKHKRGARKKHFSYFSADSLRTKAVFQQNFAKCLVQKSDCYVRAENVNQTCPTIFLRILCLPFFPAPLLTAERTALRNHVIQSQSNRNHVVSIKPEPRDLNQTGTTWSQINQTQFATYSSCIKIHEF